MLKIMIQFLILFFPMSLLFWGFILSKKDGLIKKLGINWIGFGIGSIIVTLIVDLKLNQLEYSIGIFILQVILFLIGMIVFQIKSIR